MSEDRDMTSLATLVPSFKNELAVPGTFETVFPDSDDPSLELVLRDGFAEAQVYGYFGDHVMVDGEVSPDLSAAGGMLVILFSASRVIRAQLRSLATGERYKAGSVEYEVDRSAQVLREELIFITRRIDDLIKLGRRGASTVHMLDAYPGRAAFEQLGGFYTHEVI
jgi:hypothetical protein